MSKVEKTVKKIARTIDLICKINFVCTSTPIEKRLKENQFVGESKEQTARLFAQFHSPQTERMKKELRNGPDKNDSINGNEHVGMQKRC